MLFPIKQNEIDKLIPAVATGKQFNSALGNPQKIFQRIMISAIGGVITLIYAIHIGSFPFMLAQAVGIIVYSRNLILIYRVSK